MSSLSAFAILGPTASGKTALALQLAKIFPIEIISLDSALVYRGMDIGTAKPTLSERLAVPHHLIDIISPMQTYSAADFVTDCTHLIGEIHARGKIPLIVGGTMMYYHALTQGLNQLPDANEEIRHQLHDLKEKHGLSFLYQRLQEIDATTAARLSANDSQRIERALEIFELTGKPLSTHLQENAVRTPLRLHTLALLPENRDLLHQQINRRFTMMLENGLLDEICHLRTHYPDLHQDMPSMRCVGYRQAWAHLNGDISANELLQQGQAATRQLAKRQLTWLRKIPADTVLDPYAARDVFQAASCALHHFIQQNTSNLFNENVT
ncbi:MAG: tRNA (adenosine(37)-N6)-dimethylallyltransferase MiaA [Alysiella sp.]|uniref:tRNA (adenosine(37)-N6)-dimethylallyltransferase MiaA n=1 Tax=Alysiella sp. TaxID=1872483 RepID=UPI0026DB201C|nr:tRNA (adenosine(37)-N6)-dimethylallyltransferase MiaA [Alysiella sp.]MDO4433778.1 tRNA (adenosine(37)-N6)-dimethylallyltransferase MiaA [Alysiella sp.]